jgi:hypothetical protein
MRTPGAVSPSRYANEPVGAFERPKHVCPPGRLAGADEAYAWNGQGFPSTRLGD